MNRGAMRDEGGAARAPGRTVVDARRVRLDEHEGTELRVRAAVHWTLALCREFEEGWRLHVRGFCGLVER